MTNTINETEVGCFLVMITLSKQQLYMGEKIAGKEGNPSFTVFAESSLQTSPCQAGSFLNVLCNLKKAKNILCSKKQKEIICLNLFG